MSEQRRFTLKRPVQASEVGQTACDFLAQHSGLSKSAIKDAMNKGAVWLGRWDGRNRQRKRLRRASYVLRADETLELYYDAAILATAAPRAHSIADEGRYSVWYKPAGLLAQGNEYADHCSMVRQVEQARGEAFLIHRLDREASGLMLFAHDSSTAGRLSALFQQRRIGKRYRLQVLGDFAKQHGLRGLIDTPLDGQSAITEYLWLSYDAQTNLSTLEVKIGTGRLHQIRRHLDGIGFPLYGDPRYGVGNKNHDGLRLVAVQLVFICPLSGQERNYQLDSGRVGF